MKVDKFCEDEEDGKPNKPRISSSTIKKEIIQIAQPNKQSR